MVATRNQVRRLRWVPAGNRFGPMRWTSTGNSGYRFMTGRLHRSPSIDLMGLKIVAPWYSVDLTNGEVGLGTGATIAAGIEYPIGTAAGASKAFRFAGLSTGALVDYQTLESDVLGVLLPAGSLYRLRSFLTPAGFSPYGRQCLGVGGGSMSGYGGAVDQGVFAASPSDETQTATAVAGMTTDSAYEPLLVGCTTDWTVDSWLGIGDSILAGSKEVPADGSSTTALSGDAYGNAGFFERHVGKDGRNQPHINAAQSASKASVWATPGFAARRLGEYSKYCNKAYVLLGRNDLNTRSSAQIIADLTTIYRMLTSIFEDVRFGTLLPYTTTTDSGVSLANQTVSGSETKRRDVNTWLRSGVVVPVSKVDDLEAVVRDPAEPTKWRVDGGAWSPDGTHPSRLAHIAIEAALTW